MDEFQPKKESRILSRFKQNPFVPLGMAGLLGTVGFFIYRIKSRKSVSLQLYFIQLRVGAQALAVLGICGAAFYDTYYLHGKDDK